MEEKDSNPKPTENDDTSTDPSEFVTPPSTPLHSTAPSSPLKGGGCGGNQHPLASVTSSPEKEVTVGIATRFTREDSRKSDPEVVYPIEIFSIEFNYYQDHTLQNIIYASSFNPTTMTFTGTLLTHQIYHRSHSN